MGAFINISEKNLNQQYTSHRFWSLALKLDKLLKNFDTNLYILNNPNLHLPRNHPEYLEVWKPIIYKQSCSFVDNVKVTLKLFTTGTYYLIKIIYFLITNGQRNKLSVDLSKKFNYLFISHNIDNRQYEDDFYYGDLISKVSQSGQNVLRLLIPHVANNYGISTNKAYQTIQLNVPLTKIGLSKYLLGNICAIFLLIIFTHKNNFSFFEKITILIGQMKNLDNYTITSTVDSILSNSQVDKLIMTYEGNALEKSIFYLANKYHILSGGFQHAPIIEDQHAIFKLISDNISPDFILASGPYTKSKFMKRLGDNIPIECIGSPKFLKFDEDFLRNKNDFIILLAPDGNKSSIDIFLNLGISLIRFIPNYKIVIRSHPLFNSYLISEIRKKNLSNTHFSISYNSINEDLKISGWVVYQNSSVCIQALMAKCRLIHFKHPLANIDPLFDFKNNKFLAATFFDVISIVKDVNNNAPVNTSDAMSFAQSYFDKPNIRVL